MSELTISAIVPNFNHAQFLPRSIGALLNQPVLPCEIMVIDDASTDNSLEVLGALAQKHRLIRVCPNERNLGVNASLNRGMAMAQGDYILTTAADDEVRPGLFEQATRMFREHPEAGVCSGISEWRCTSTGLVWYSGGSMPREACYLPPGQMVSLARRGRLAINNQNAVYKKSALAEAGGWLPELHWFSDWFGAYVVGFRHGMCHVPEVLSNFYLYPNSYYNSDASAHAKRRLAMTHVLEALESEPCSDVAPLIGRSGLLGQFGWPMLRLIARDPTHRRFLTPALLFLVGRRSAEIAGRKLFPNWLARFCLRLFYGRR